MSEEATLRFLLERLESPVARDRVYALRGLAMSPIADRQLLAATEKLLDDRAICVLQIPHRFGETRILAAQAASAIREQLGETGVVVLADAFLPLRHDDVSRLAQQHGVEIGSDPEGTVQALRTLVAMGHVPLRTIKCGLGRLSIQNEI